MENRVPFGVCRERLFLQLESDSGMERLKCAEPDFVALSMEDV